MSKRYERVERCYKSIEGKVPFTPKVALILGSGLGDYAEHLEVEGSIDYHEIQDFPVSTVSGHKGRYVFAHIGEVPVVLMQGRVHFYEGYPIEDVVLPTRLMQRMGAEILFLTNACGESGLSGGRLHAPYRPHPLLCSESADWRESFRARRALSGYVGSV